MKLSTVVAAVNAIEVARNRRQKRDVATLASVVEYFNPGATINDFVDYGESN